MIPTDKDALKTWLVDLSGNIAVSGAGIAFLDAQITDLENKCSAERSRIGQERADENESAAKQKIRAHCQDLTGEEMIHVFG